MKWTIPEKVVDQARELLNEGRVMSLKQDAGQVRWQADVLDDKRYRVHLDGTAKEWDECQCPDNTRGFCRHTVAVELYLRELGYQRVMAQNDDLSDIPKMPNASQQFKEELMTFQETYRPWSPEIAPYQLMLMIEEHEFIQGYAKQTGLVLSLKIGQAHGKTYVVRDLGYFFEQLRQSKTIEIHQAVYYLQPAHFDTATWGLLSELASEYAYIKQATVNKHVTNLGSKYMTASSLSLRKWLETPDYQAMITIKISENVLTWPFINQTAPLIHSRISQSEKGFTIALDRVYQQHLSYMGWFLVDGQLYVPTLEVYRLFQLLDERLKRMDNARFTFAREQQSEVFNHLLPVLKQVGTYEIASDILEALIDEPLDVRFFLERVQDTLQVSLFFKYGEYWLRPDEKGPDTLLHDEMEEKRVTFQTEALFGCVLEKGELALPFIKGETIYHFFKSQLPALRSLGEVVLSEEVQAAYLEGAQYQPDLEVTDNDSWFSFKFDISGIEPEEIDAVWKSLRQKKAFHQLSDGSILDLMSDNYQEISHGLQNLRGKWQLKEGNMRLTPFQALQLSTNLADAQLFKESETIEKMLLSLINPRRLTETVPDKLNATLRPYQLTGYRWLDQLSKWQLGGILADDMGLGKTIQTIAYLLKHRNEESLSLIVAPASLVYNWQQECQQFAPTLRTQIVMGGKEQREQAIKAAVANQMDCLITSYASLRQDIDLYHGVTIETLILDEAQMVKNSETKTFRAIQSLKVAQRFALSGTPIENHIDELWSIFHLIMLGFLPSRRQFQKLPVTSIQKMIQPFVLRRTKQEVLQELPEKIETNLYSDLTEEQKTLYVAYLQQMTDTLNQMSGSDFQKNRWSILAGLTRLRQICCDPRLFVEDYTGESGKLNQLKDLVVSAKASGRRLLIFSQFTKMLTLIETELTELDIASFYLRGSTPAKQRQEMVNAFNSGERDVFLISLKAGGTGLNLTGADTVVLYDLWWNPAVEEQASSRAHRMGQKKVVEVWRLMARGSIEERIYQLQEEKRDLFQSVMTSDEVAPTTLSEEDIRQLLQWKT